MHVLSVAETASTNDDVCALAESGSPEALWLRADRQTGGRGRQGRAWLSPPGNLYASTLVRLREGDPPAATLALVAGVALHEAAALFLTSPSPLGGGEGEGVRSEAARRPADGTPHPTCARSLRDQAPISFPRKGEREVDRLLIKWPNDLMSGPAKLAGILLERTGDAVVIGFGVNLAHHPETLERPTTSIAALAGAAPEPSVFLETLAEVFDRWLTRWRTHGLAPIRAAWLAAAHPPGTALSTAEGEGLFDGLDEDGALRLRLADGRLRAIHAGDVFLM